MSTSFVGSVVCPRCSHRFEFQPEYSGRRIFCPQCGNPLPPSPPERPGAIPPIPWSYGSAMGVQYAGFWIRVVAHLVDGLLIMVPAVVANMIIPVFGGLAVGVVYEGLLVANWNGQTVGRKLCNIRVVCADGSPCDTARSWGRAGARLINLLTAGLSFLIIPFEPRKRGVHDFVAQTLTVYAS